jgi:hypothetical protein
VSIMSLTDKYIWGNQVPKSAAMGWKWKHLLALVIGNWQLAHWRNSWKVPNPSDKIFFYCIFLSGAFPFWSFRLYFGEAVNLPRTIMPGIINANDNQVCGLIDSP